jgi:hypothetical protein
MYGLQTGSRYSQDYHDSLFDLVMKHLSFARLLHRINAVEISSYPRPGGSAAHQRSTADRARLS